MTNPNPVRDTDTTALAAHLAGVVILAGGASTRMGRPKAELTLPHGERLLDYHVRHALDLSCDNISVPIMIADNGRGFRVDEALYKASRNAAVPIFHIEDYGAAEDKENKDHSQVKYNGGALVAIASALQTLKNLATANLSADKWLLVISCDSLIAAPRLWQQLKVYIAHRVDDTYGSDKSVICLTDAAHLYPLLGLYSLSIEPELQAYIDSHHRQVMRFIEPKVQPVAVAPEWQHLTNFNTPADFKRACAALNERRILK